MDNQPPDTSTVNLSMIVRPTSSAAAPRTMFLLTSLDQCPPRFLTELRQHLESASRNVHSRTTFLLTSLDQCSPQFLAKLRQHLESSSRNVHSLPATDETTNQVPRTRPTIGNLKDDNTYDDDQSSEPNAQGPPHVPNTLTSAVSQEESTPP
jgi:hypothetical protein